MAERITRKMLKQIETVIKNRTMLPVFLNWDYGRPRFMIVARGGTERALSPRMSLREMAAWLDGFLEGFDYGAGRSTPGED